MKLISVFAAGALLLAAGAANASPLSQNLPGLNYSPIELVQAKKKEETVTQKVKRTVKRTWRNLTGTSYAFCARCPIPIPVSAKACSARAKSAEEARSICQSQNRFCYVTSGAC